jgi:hypothetical protein
MMCGVKLWVADEGLLISMRVGGGWWHSMKSPFIAGSLELRSFAEGTVQKSTS